MKKLISCILVLSLVLSSLGTIAVFADDVTVSFSDSTIEVVEDAENNEDADIEDDGDVEYQMFGLPAGSTTFYDDFSGLTTDGVAGGTHLADVVSNTNTQFSGANYLYYKTWKNDDKAAVQLNNGTNHYQYLEGNGWSDTNGNAYLVYSGNFGGNSLLFETAMNDSNNYSVKQYVESFNAEMYYSTDNASSWTSIDYDYVDYSVVWNYIGWNGYGSKVATFVVSELPAGTTDVKVGFRGDWHKKVISVSVDSNVDTSSFYSVADIYSGVVLFDNFSTITSSSNTGSDAVAGAKFTNGKWSWVYKTGTITGVSGTQYTSQYIEGWGNSWHDTGNFKYSGTFGGDALEVITYMTMSHEQTITDLDEYIEHFALTVKINDDTDITSTVKARKIDETSDGGAWIVKYYVNELPSSVSSITLQPTGNWHHKLLSVGVYEEPQMLTAFVDNFSEIERSSEVTLQAPITGAKFAACQNLVVKTKSSGQTAFDSDIIGKVKGTENNGGTTSVTYEGDFEGLRARFALAIPAENATPSYKTAYLATYPCSNVLWSKWDVIREYYDLENKINIYAGDASDNLTEVSALYWEGTSVSGYVCIAVDTAALPADAAYLKFELADISASNWNILSCATFDEVYTSNDVTVVDGIGYRDATKAYSDFNDNTMTLSQDVYLDSFPFINAYVNTSSYGIYTTDGDARKTTGTKVKINKSSTAAAGKIAVLGTGTAAERSAYTVDTTNGLYGILAGKTINGETSYTATYHLTNKDKDVTHTFDCTGLSGAVNFGLTFYNVPAAETITYVE